MVPLMMGLIGSSVLSGQYISKTGRYRFFPIVGTGLMAIGMLMLSQLHFEVWSASKAHRRWQELLAANPI